jgi:hypothetical protein
MKQVYEYELHISGAGPVGLIHVEATTMRLAIRELHCDYPRARVIEWIKTPISEWRQGSRVE